jgi:hypothetical protein
MREAGLDQSPMGGDDIRDRWFMWNVVWTEWRTAASEVLDIVRKSMTPYGPRSVLETLDPKARDDLRRVLIRDQADRDAISSRLMRYRDQNGQD